MDAIPKAEPKTNVVPIQKELGVRAAMDHLRNRQHPTGFSGSKYYILFKLFKMKTRSLV